MQRQTSGTESSSWASPLAPETIATPAEAPTRFAPYIDATAASSHTRFSISKLVT